MSTVKKLSDMEPFEGQQFLIDVQKRGCEIVGGRVDGTTACLLGLVEYLAKNGILTAHPQTMSMSDEFADELAEITNPNQ